MPGRFAGRNVIVTGASRGIGKGIAERFAAEGANVAVTARTVDRHPTLPGSLDETVARLRRYGTDVVSIRADLADADDRARIVPEATAALGPIDVLVNNAAAALYNSMLDYPLRRRRVTMEVNVNAPIDLIQQVLPSMIERREGWIVNVSSATARHPVGPPYATDGVKAVMGFYGASKAALNRVTAAFAVELHEKGIRINTVEPVAAVLSEGADVLVGDILREDQIESLEAMVEAVIALCDCDVDRTGRCYASLDLLGELRATVMTLDGTEPYPGGYRRAR